MNEPTSKEELQEYLIQGKISRRQFLRSALVMDLSLSMAQSLLAACAPRPHPVWHVAAHLCDAAVAAG